MNAARRLHHQRRRMHACARLAARYGDAWVASLAEGYARKLDGWAKVFVPADADWFAGMLDTFGPGFNDVARSTRAARAEFRVVVREMAEAA